MPKLFPADRRLSVQLVYANNKSIRKTARILEVSKSTVQRWLALAVAIAEPSTLQKPERKKPKMTQIIDIVDSSIQNDPFTSCRKLQAIILEKLCLKVSKELVRIAIVRLDYTRKKARFYGLAKNALQLNGRFIRDDRSGRRLLRADRKHEVAPMV